MRRRFSTASSGSIPVWNRIPAVATRGHLIDRSLSPNDLLRHMMEHASIMKFEVAEPSLHDIFVNAVSA